MSPKTKKDELGRFLQFATELAREAGAHTLRYFRTSLDVERKDDDSPVTRADRETETLVRERIMAAWPEHGILGEEFDEHNPGARWRWIVDPIDGTKAFIHGVPLYCVLLALECDGEPHLGVIYNPPLDELVAAATGRGCAYNGQPCRVRDTERLEDAWLNATDMADMARRRPRFTAELLRRVKSGRTWADAYAYLLVATGRADIAMDPIMNEWDAACLKPIITEAGGRYSDLDGLASIRTGHALATNGRLHEAVLELTRLDAG